MNFSKLSRNLSLAEGKLKELRGTNSAMDNKELFDYWHGQVQLKNLGLIGASDHIETFKLRHNCTNYDDLWHSREVNALDEPDRSRVVAIIKYECTAKVLQHRASLLRERANQYASAYRGLDAENTKLRKFLKLLQEKLFGKDKEIEGLKSKVTSLESENEALRAESENEKAYAELLSEFEQLKKEFAAVEKRRKELAKNNQSLGGRVAHTKRFRLERDKAREEVKALKAQLQSLDDENKALRSENEELRSELTRLKKQNKLGIVSIRRNETPRAKS